MEWLVERERDAKDELSAIGRGEETLSVHYVLLPIQHLRLGQ